MSGLTDPTAFAAAHPGVTVEIPRRASRRQRVAHALSHAMVRRFFDIAVWLDRRRVLSPSQMLVLAGWAERVMVVVRPCRGTRVRRVPSATFQAEWVWQHDTPDPREVTDSAILYLHGGGLVSCGLNSHRRLVSRIARAAGVPVLSIGYRQIPQVHVTDTVVDCVNAYRYLLRLGFPAGRIVVAGDSAGGGLAFALALAARRQGLALPGGIAAIAPWADYDSANRRAHPNNRADPFLSADALALPTKWGMEIDGVLDPAWSAVGDTFHNLPPVLIQVGSTEVLMADTEQLAAKCAEAGVPVTVQVWQHAIHVFQVAADVLPDARDAIAHLAEFITTVLDNAALQPAPAPAWAHQTSA